MEAYLKTLDKDITELHLFNKGLAELTDLSDFTKLEKLLCFKNKLTSLPENLPLHCTSQFV